VGGLWSRLTGKAALLNSDRMRELEQSGWTCNTDKAKRELGFEPEVSLRRGLSETAAWYREEGWL
jgi:nucleoside-diphosphate-sugar epimerase